MALYSVKNTTDRPGKRLSTSDKIFSTFVGSLPEDFGQLKKAVLEKDLKKMKAMAHRAKGGCFSVGAVKLAELFSNLEKELSTDSENVDLIVVEIDKEIVQINKEVSTRFKIAI